MTVLPSVALVSNDQTFRLVLADFLRREHGIEPALKTADELANTDAYDLCLWDESSQGRAPVSAVVRGVRLPLRLAEISSIISALCDKSRMVLFQAGQRALCFDVSSRHLHNHAGEAIALTDKEAALVLCLHGAVNGINREALAQQVWGHAVEAQTLATHMYRLRGKIKQLMHDADVITNTAEGYELKTGSNT